MAHPGGRPRKFKDSVEFAGMVDKFFDYCDMNGERKTMERLAVYLGVHRETLMEYEQIPEFSDTIKNAKQKCLTFLVDDGLNARNPAMHIFLLKNNYGYKDKQEIDATVNVNMSEAIQAARQRAKQIDGNL